MIIVSNSGPIISFSRAVYLGLLELTLHEITIPVGVYDEIVIGGANKPGATEVKRAAWIKRGEIKNRIALDRLPSSLGLGEREAIVLAQELNAALLIDDHRARMEAEKMGLVCFGSLRVLKEAKEGKLIEAIKPIVDELRQSGLRIKDTLYRRFLRELGE